VKGSIFSNIQKIQFYLLFVKIGSQGKILDRVWQVFGGLEAESIPLVEEKITIEKIQVISKRYMNLLRIIKLVPKSTLY